MTGGGILWVVCQLGVAGAAAVVCFFILVLIEVDEPKKLTIDVLPAVRLVAMSGTSTIST